jgi:hypothetical protein
MFSLRDVIRQAYRYSGSKPEDQLVSAWCRDSVLASLAGLVELVEGLRQRFALLLDELGNDAENVEKAAAFLVCLRDIQGCLQQSPGLPESLDWCPAPLRPVD